MKIAQQPEEAVFLKQGIRNTRINLIPHPVSLLAGEGIFMLENQLDILIDPPTRELERIAQYLVEKLAPASGCDFSIKASSTTSKKGSIYLTVDEACFSLGEEGYKLVVEADFIRISAYQPAGLFWGIQSLRQLLPASIERAEQQEGPWTVPSLEIEDYPRYAWRGIMLDVARHFFSVEEIKRTIDLLAYYKINRFHLHLSDDQGWRIHINSWPDLTRIGGSTAVNGDLGGFYTQAMYSEIAAYAQQHYMILIPEIDMPGHTHAALAAYAELNSTGITPPLFTGIQVGFSSLCIEKEITYQLIEQVIKEIAALTPGPYIHIGGDEAQATRLEDYQYFMARVQDIVRSHGKEAIGWEEICQAKLHPGTIAQVWNGTAVKQAAEQGAKIILSPAQYAYLDIKYHPKTELGLDWAGYIEVRTSYDWDPENLLEGISPEAILGVESPLWSETIRTIAEIEFMAFPRVIGIAEKGWSPGPGQNWEDYAKRLGAHGPRLKALKVNFYESPQVIWE
jgi:hexosaminidase